MRRLKLYPFRFKNPVSGKWVKARYVAERHEIEGRHAPGEWEIIGPPEIREIDEEWSYFSPWTNSQPSETPVKEPPGHKPPAEKDPPSKDAPVNEPKQTGAHCEHEPQLDEIERFLVLLFLRRYVAYCARGARYAQMNGAAQLHREVIADR